MSDCESGSDGSDICSSHESLKSQLRSPGFPTSSDNGRSSEGSEGSGDSDSDGSGGTGSRSESSDSESSSSSDDSSSSSSSVSQSDSDTNASDNQVETLEVEKPETLLEHIASHSYPAHVRHCDACKFYKNRRKCIAQTIFYDTQCGAEKSWLYYQRGFIGCLVCRAARKKNVFGQCMAIGKLSNIRRHQDKTVDHQEALALWNDPTKAEPEQPEEKLPKQVSDNPTALSYSHVLFQRELIAQGGSFQDFRRWATTARLVGVGDFQAMISADVAANLTQAMAETEMDVTRKLVEAAAMLGLIADARADVVGVCLRGIVWRWPGGIPKNPLPTGVTSLNGVRGPWVVERIAGMPSLGSDHSSRSKAQAVLQALHQAGPANLLDSKVRFYCSDGASDAKLAGEILRVKLPQLAFSVWDSSHAHMLVLKNALEDDEIRITEQLLVSSKSPPSVAKFLSTSLRFRQRFKEEQQAACLQVLEHFGWAPQRFTSKARPLGRAALRLTLVSLTLAWG